MTQLDLVDPNIVIRGLTLWQPMAWAISDLKEPQAKRIENRPWQPWAGVTHVAIHAGSKYHRPHAEQIAEAFGIEVPRKLPHGVVLCVARIDGVADPTCSDPWFCGPGVDGDPNYGWRLADVVRLPSPLPCRGALGLWRLPSTIEAICLKHVKR